MDSKEELSLGSFVGKRQCGYSQKAPTTSRGGAGHVGERDVTGVREPCGNEGLARNTMEERQVGALHNSRDERVTMLPVSDGGEICIQRSTHILMVQPREFVPRHTRMSPPPRSRYRMLPLLQKIPWTSFQSKVHPHPRKSLF